MTDIDHDEAARIATGYGVTYTSPSDAAVRLVFDAYLDVMRRLKEVQSMATINPSFAGSATCSVCGGFNDIPHFEDCPLHGLKLEDTP